MLNYLVKMHSYGSHLSTKAMAITSEWNHAALGLIENLKCMLMDKIISQQNAFRLKWV